jgi:hypothetical protein
LSGWRSVFDTMNVRWAMLNSTRMNS